MHRLRLLSAGLCVVMTASLSGAAHADAANYYKKDARVVAADLGCAPDSYKPDRNKKFWFSAGSCKAGGLKVGFATFEGPSRQASYKSQLVTAISSYFPPGTYYFVEEKGAVALGPNAGKKAASLAQRRLGGKVTSIRVR